MQYRSAFDALTIYVHTHERAALPGHAPRLTHRPPRSDQHSLEIARDTNR